LNRRSLNSEAIVCLEAVLLPTRMTAQEQLLRARSMRASLDFRVSVKDLNAFKRDGRA
jgi:antitoxin FitA